MKHLATTLFVSLFLSIICSAQLDLQPLNKKKNITQEIVPDFLIEELHQNWNDSTMTWENNRIFQFQKNENWQNILETKKIWLQTNWSEPRETVTKAYDTQNQLIEIETEYASNPFTPEVRVAFRDNFFYDLEGQLTHHYNYFWDYGEQEFINNYDIIYEYREDGLESQVTVIYYQDGFLYDLYYVEINKYNSQNQLIDQKVHSVNYNTLEEENYSQVIYTYNTNGQIETDAKAFWDTDNNVWENNERNRFFYNDLEQLAVSFEAYWDGLAWVENRWKTFEYNEDGFKSKLVSLMQDTGGEDRILNTTIFSYDALGNLITETSLKNDGTENAFRKVFIYDAQMELNQSNLSELLISPNPASELLTINLPKDQGPSTISILTINGQLVLEKKTSNEAKIKLNLNSLLPGTYLLNITNTSTNQTAKIVVQ